MIIIAAQLIMLVLCAFNAFMLVAVYKRVDLFGCQLRDILKWFKERNAGLIDQLNERTKVLQKYEEAVEPVINTYLENEKKTTEILENTNKCLGQLAEQYDSFWDILNGTLTDIRRHTERTNEIIQSMRKEMDLDFSSLEIGNFDGFGKASDEAKEESS